MSKKTSKDITPTKKTPVQEVDEQAETTTKEVKLLIVDKDGVEIDAITKEEKEGFKRYLAELREDKDIDVFGDITGVTFGKRHIIVEIQGGSLSKKEIRKSLINDFKAVNFQPEDRTLELTVVKKKETNGVEVPIKKEKTYPYTFKFFPHLNGIRVQFREKEKEYIGKVYNNYGRTLNDKPYKLSLPGVVDESLTLHIISTIKLQDNVLENIKIDLIDLYTKERSSTDIRDLYLRDESPEANDKPEVKHISSYSFILHRYTKELEEEVLDKLFEFGLSKKKKHIKQKRVRVVDREIIVTLETTKFEDAQAYIDSLFDEFITLEPIERKTIVYLRLCVTDNSNIVLENMDDRKQKDILSMIDSILEVMDNKLYSFGAPTLQHGVIEIPLKMRKFKLDSLEEKLVSNIDSVLEGSDETIHFIGSIVREEITNEKVLIFSVVDQNEVDINNLTPNEVNGIQAAFAGLIQPLRDATENFLEVNVNGNTVTVKLITKSDNMVALGNTIAGLFSDSNIQMDNRLLLLKYRSHKG